MAPACGALSSGVRRHMNRLAKSDSRERWRQTRDLWNEFDPIGVMAMADWPRDEYESYLGPTLRLLESNASIEELQRYLKQVTLEHMGLNESPQFEMSRRLFAKRLRDWFNESWSGTHVEVPSNNSLERSRDR